MYCYQKFVEKLEKHGMDKETLKLCGVYSQRDFLEENHVSFVNSYRAKLGKKKIDFSGCIIDGYSPHPVIKKYKTKKIEPRKKEEPLPRRVRKRRIAKSRRSNALHATRVKTELHNRAKELMPDGYITFKDFAKKHKCEEAHIRKVARNNKGTIKTIRISGLKSSLVNEDDMKSWLNQGRIKSKDGQYVLSELAKQFGIHVDSIRKMMRRKGIKQSSYGCVDEATYKELCSLYAKHELVKVSELYDELKIKKQTGNRILSKMGIIRPKKGWIAADDADKIRLYCKGKSLPSFL